MKIWNTKYCLTKGITTHEATGGTTGMVRITDEPYRCDPYLHREGRDWHRTHESALIRAHIMKAEKIESLHRQIKKLSTMNFTKNTK